mgnify:CR=1 FL=1
MKKTKLHRLRALALCALLLLSLFPVTSALADGDGAIHIRTAEDLQSLARSCTLDSYSRGKKVVLDNDLVLESTDALPIPSFGGTFDGGGHTISGLDMEDSISPAGLFGVVQKDGVVKNLRVEGALTPSGDSQNLGGIAGENHGTIESCTFNGSVSGKRNVGGIAGCNAVTGVIRSCEASGAIFGQNMTGGIAGYNLGAIVSSKNRAYVNIESTDPAIDLGDLSFEFSLDLSKLSQLDTLSVSTDTGGVAGCSSGAISECVNEAAIGYQHIGYNVGGIVGRSSGQVRSCTNSGAICGRKDVGGIAGQMEPYVRTEVSASQFSVMKSQLDELSRLVEKAVNDAQYSTGEICDRLSLISGYLSDASDAAGDVRVNVDLDAITPPSIDIDGGIVIGPRPNISDIVSVTNLNMIVGAITAAGSQLSLITENVKTSSTTLSSDLRSINSKFNELSNTMFSAIASVGGSSGSIITDASSTDVNSVTLGKVSGSKNTAAVYGDVNTGGIAGSMAIEYTLDPEDDVTGSLSGSYRKQYEYKAIVQQCVNTGDISGKRSYVGGIVGRMDLGYVTACEGYGSATSENGSYVGGIAGVTGASVCGNYAKCTLSGKQYVGGIVGSGVETKADGSGSNVTWNYSLVDITDCQQYAGAVSGSDTGTFEHNYYVSDSLPGINRQGFAGRAEPISFSQLSAIASVPEGMKTFTLTFVADEEEVSRRSFAYGASFDESAIPDIPEKEGYYAHWDRTDLQNLHFDTVVTAVYEAYTPGLASEQTREGGLSVLLVEGDYSDGDSIKVTAEPLTPEAFDVQSGSPLDRVKGYFSCLSRGELPPMLANCEVLEQWKLELADDGQTQHTVRYLPPDGHSSPRIYVREGGAWQKVDTGTMGSYLTFPVTGTSVEIAAVSTLSVGGIWLGALGVLLVLILLIVLLAKRSKRRARRRAEQQASAVAQAEAIVRDAQKDAPAPDDTVPTAVAAPEAASVTESSAQTSSDTPLTTPAEPAVEAAAPADPDSIEARLARAEEELRLLREEHEARENTLTQPAVKPVKPPRKKRRWLPVLITVLVLLAAAAVFFLNSGVKKDLEAYHLVETRMKQDPLSMDLAVDASYGKLNVQADAAVTRTKVDGTTLTCIDRDGAALYYANGVIYLANGRAYPIAPAYPDYSSLLDQTAELCRSLTIEKSVDGKEKIYTLTAEGEDAAALLHLLASDDIADAAALTSLRVELIAESGELMELRFRSEGAGDLRVEASVLFRDSASAPVIPEEVRSAMRSSSTEVSGTLTDDTLRLLQALSALYGQDTLSADIAFSADCGPIVLSDTLQYDRHDYDGQSISCIRKNTLAFYFSDGVICDESGNKLDSADLVDSAQLIDLSCELLMNGTAACTEAENGRSYTLTLDEDGMTALSAAIAPGIKTQNVSFTSGRIEALVGADGALRSISISCSGALHLILTDAPAAVSAVITPTTREVSFSQQALSALK